MSSSDTEGVETLSIIGHDLVYAQIDKRVHPLLLPFLSEFGLDKDFNLVLPDLSALGSDEITKRVYQIFGFKNGQKLTPMSGLNEFLSAIAFTRLLKDILDEWELTQLGSCIESTIPFRGKDSAGHTPPAALAQRLSELNKTAGLGKNENEITTAVQMGVDVCNRDVSGFGSSDADRFLTGTWRLLVESNPVLRNPLYTVNEYRHALAKMEGFFSFLTPEIIFREYKGKPGQASYQSLLKNAQTNLEVGRKYLQVKIMSLDILSAICELTGGDAPLILFTGNVNPEGHGIQHAEIEHHLDPNIPIIKDEKRDLEVLRLLKVGRSAPSEFDLRHSPIAAYLFERLNSEQMDQLISASKVFGAKQISPIDYLRYFPSLLRYSLLFSISKVAETRGTKILEIIQKLGQ